MPSQLRHIFSKLIALAARKRLENELEEEIIGHIGRLTEEHERRGMPREEALYAARRQFGGATQLQEWLAKTARFRGSNRWRGIFEIRCAR